VPRTRATTSSEISLFSRSSLSSPQHGAVFVSSWRSRCSVIGPILGFATRVNDEGAKLRRADQLIKLSRKDECSSLDIFRRMSRQFSRVPIEPELFASACPTFSQLVGRPAYWMGSPPGRICSGLLATSLGRPATTNLRRALPETPAFPELGPRRLSDSIRIRWLRPDRVILRGPSLLYERASTLPPE
jgi:hypothetical protein